MIQDLKPLIGKLTNFAKDRMGFSRPPKLFLKQDSENAKSCLGKTAHYDPGEESITLFVTDRHPKDVLRSFAHELVHHTQNLRGDLSPEKCGDMGKKYAQENPHMRKMEEEAYLVGNMCFRDWEDSEKFSLQESKILKENKTMTKKITKESLEEMIRNILKEKFETEAIAEEEEIEEQSRTDRPDRVAGRDAGGRRLDEEEVEEASTPKHDDDPALKGGQSKLPDELQKGIIDSSDGDDKKDEKDQKVAEGEEAEEAEEPETQQESLYRNRFGKRNSKLYEQLVKKWAK